MISTITAAAGAALALTAAGTVAAAPADAATVPWPTSVAGSPSVHAGDAGGDYLWHDADGFHLRVTHPGSDRVVYTGVITANRAMSAKGVDLEKGDSVKLSHDRHVLTFTFVDYGRIDGVNFTTNDATKLVVSRLHEGDRNLPADQVYLGSAKTNPASVPFVLTR